MFLPCKERHTDILHLRADDICLHRTNSTELLRTGEVSRNARRSADFNGKNAFSTTRIYSEFSTGYIDLLDINEHTRAAFPWMYVISSRWFASILFWYSGNARKTDEADSLE